MELKVHGEILHVHHWDGIDHFGKKQIIDFTDKARQTLAIRTSVITYGTLVSQVNADTCGAVALEDLDIRLGLWTEDDFPDENLLHHHLLEQHLVSTLYGRGWGIGEEEILTLPARELLHQDGVPENRSEKRVMLAMKKLGADKIREAMGSKNAWGALKALGSMPKHNFLWAKPDELDRLIKMRASSKFKVST